MGDSLAEAITDNNMPQARRCISPRCVSFEARQVLGAQTLWVNREFADIEGVTELTPAEFAAKTAFISPDSSIVMNGSIALGKAVTLKAERYGGSGIGRHGGGARTGNLGSLQLKGVGRNPLAQAVDSSFISQFHNTGTLSLADALHEVASSALVQAALPNGAIRCLGLVLISEDAAVYPPRGDGRPRPAVIAVRERSLRPAHFLPNSGFEIPPSLLFSVGGDSARVRNIFQSTLEAYGTLEGCLGFITDFADLTAHQLQAARFRRLNHGALSPSNISTRGEWVDTAAASLLPPGVDYSPSSWTTYYSQERAYPKLILAEWLHTTRRYLSAPHLGLGLSDFYDRRCEIYGIIETGRLMGCPNVRDSRTQRAMSRLLDRVINGFNRQTPLLVGGFTNPYSDPAVAFLVDCFRMKAGIRPLVNAASVRHLDLICQYFDEAGGRLDPRQLSSLLLNATKRFLFAPLFYRGRIMAEASYIVLQSSPEEAGEMLNRIARNAEWVFASGKRSVIFQGENLGIYDDADQVVRVEVNGNVDEFGGVDRYDAVARVIESYGAFLYLPPINAYPAWPEYSFLPAVKLLLVEMGVYARL